MSEDIRTSLAPDCGAETRFLDPSASYLVLADRIWAEPGRVLAPGWLLVRGGRVADSGSGPFPQTDRVSCLDLRGFDLTPGLIDVHVHLDLDPGSGAGLEARIEGAAISGLAAVRDGGSAGGRILASRERVERRLRLRAAGPALFAPGRYGRFIGRPVANRDEMASTVEELAGAGADLVKVLASGPVALDAFGRVGPPQFSRSDLVFLAALARERGLPLMAHANGPEAVTHCIAAGVDSIEHGYFMGDEALRRLAASDTVWVPTIEPMAALGRIEAERPPRAHLIERTVRHQVEQLARARQLGVRLATGTDAGAPGVEFGPGLRSELAWWFQAGLDHQEVLAAATFQAAELLGLADDLGRLTQGAMAFLIGYDRARPLDRALTRPPDLVIRPGAPGPVRRVP
ncbi:MAG: amidohydrolase family protein [Proteobacteria bacterium]|nr:amidohydrolase family protein [Pseudomonadota bacterium]